MNIVVCVKAVPVKGNTPSAKADGSGLSTEGDLYMNESDEYALEQALLLRRNLGGKVTAITVGSIRSQDILHVSLAKGVDDTIRIDADEFDPNVVSFLLARTIKRMDHDLILTGVESSDGMSSQVPIALGAELGVPYVYAVTNLAAESNETPLSVTRELGGGRYQNLEVEKPALLCMQSGTVPLTYTPVVKLIHARRKGIAPTSISDLGITSEELVQRRKTKIIDIKPIEKNSSTQWLSGSPEEISLQVIDIINKAL